MADKKLSPRKLRMIEMWMEGKSVHKIATEINVSTRTIQRWLKNSEVCDKISEIQDLRLEHTFNFAVDKTQKILEKLYGIVMDDDCANRDRISAARQICLSMSDYKAILESRRISQIEQHLEGLQSVNDVIKKYEKK